MRKILWVIPISAAVIAGLVGFKLTRPPVAAPAGEIATTFFGPAPLFQLQDERLRPLKVSRYVGRHKLLVIFFDGTNGPDKSPLLMQARADYDKLQKTGAMVMAISSALPQHNRAGIERVGEFPFPLLSDIVDFEVHRRWGAFDDAVDKPLEGVFVVDRAGNIRAKHLGPDRLGTADLWIGELQQVR